MFFKTTVGLAGTILIAAGWYISPIMKPFPKPTGPYPVGLKIVELVNSDLINTQETRTLVVHMLYPADDSARAMQEAPYLADKMPYFQKAMAQYLQVPAWVTRVLFRNIKTHAAVDAPIRSSAQKYPVVLFSHGLLGVPSDMYMVILEDIASHGYVVMAIDHPQLNELTLYKNGRVVSSHAMSVQFQKMSSQQQKDFQSKSIEVYKADMKFVIDQLNQSPEGLFSHQFDLDRIAVMGHSAGGTAAIEFCRSDARSKAAIDLDGWYDHIIGQEPIGKPLLLMFGSKSLEVGEPTPEYLKRKELTREQYFEREQKIADHRTALCADHQSQTIVIPGAEHGDFGDEVLLKWPLRAWSAADAYATIRSINQGVIQFLDMHLKVSK